MFFRDSCRQGCAVERFDTYPNPCSMRHVHGQGEFFVKEGRRGVARDLCPEYVPNGGFFSQDQGGGSKVIAVAVSAAVAEISGKSLWPLWYLCMYNLLAPGHVEWAGRSA